MSEFVPKKYEKDESNDPIFKQTSGYFVIWSRLIPIVVISSGLILLASQVVFPLVVFKTSDVTLRPVSNTVLGKAAGFSDFAFAELGTSSETNLEAKPVETIPASNVPDYYYLSIPRLNIKNAQVATKPASLEPNDALGHFIGSALPGENGNTFIYGHSVLPFFYNPRNYKTIFSTLNTLRVGDKLTINYNNVEYVYVVDSKTSVAPEKVNPLGYYKPAYLNEPTLTLMTCDPPGTKMKRLLISAVLEE